MGTSEYVFIALFMIIPGIAGAVLARKRGKNMFLWGGASFLLPVCVFILWYNNPNRK